MKKLSLFAALIAALMLAGCGNEGDTGGQGSVVVSMESVKPTDLETEFREEYQGLVITAYNGSGGDITLPAEIDGTRVRAVDKSAFTFKTEIISVEIPDSVVSIGDSAFYNCTGLKLALLSGEIKTIGAGAFGQCTSLTEIVIPEGVTAVADETFAGCKSLTSAVLPEGLTEIGYYAFYNCAALTEITIPDSVTVIGDSAFKGCDNITVTYKGETYDAKSVSGLYNG